MRLKLLGINYVLMLDQIQTSKLVLFHVADVFKCKDLNHVVFIREA